MQFIELTNDEVREMLHGATNIIDNIVTVGLLEMQERQFTKANPRTGIVEIYYIYKIKNRYNVSKDGRGKKRLPVKTVRKYDRKIDGQDNPEKQQSRE